MLYASILFEIIMTIGVRYQLGRKSCSFLPLLQFVHAILRIVLSVSCYAIDPYNLHVGI